jgi:hypothetical protein
VFEEECDQCGGALADDDAYDPTPDVLRCTTCGRELAGGIAHGNRSEDHEGSYTVDDDCPICGGELSPATEAGDVRAQPEYKVARAAAESLLKRYGGAIPVDVEGIARGEGLAVKRGSFSHDGLLIGDVIEVPDQARTAQRFVIAHELGHWHLRHKIPEEKIEREANAFAGELLVPRASLRKAVTSGSSVDELRRSFQVSREVMAIALSQARLINRVSLGLKLA